ncbi:MAG: hypothetical protein M1821_004528 [Bathelium mastoideum]|nr:MAG: hypothetical protein M1821_004528 [Bathelium mastoideum]
MDSPLHARKRSARGAFVSESSPRSLLDLPVEIRDLIYHQVLCPDDTPILIDQESIQLQQPPLTRTCRLIRAECLPIFYGKNVFHTTIYKRHIHDGPVFRMYGFNAVWSGDDLMLWLSMIGEENAASLRTIVFFGDNLRVKACFTPGKKFRLSRIEEARCDIPERNTVVDYRKDLQEEILSVDMCHILRSEYICWIRDKLVDLANHTSNGRSNARYKETSPPKLQLGMPKDSKIRLELLFFK